MGQTQSSDAWDVAWGPVTPQGRRRCCLIAGCAQDRDFGAARRLLSLGWRVIVACRDPTAAAATVRDLRAGVAESAQQGPPTPAWAAGGAGSAPDGAGAALTTSASSKAEPGREPGREPGPEPGHVSAMQLDVTSLASVRAFAREYEAAGHRLDVLLCAAGAPPSEVKRVSVDGLDLQMAANYLGYFHLVQRLLPCLQASAPARVVFASSPAARRGQIKYTDLQFRTGEYDAARMYQQSTVALVRQRSLCNCHACIACLSALPMLSPPMQCWRGVCVHVRGAYAPLWMRLVMLTTLPWAAPVGADCVRPRACAPPARDWDHFEQRRGGW